MQERAEEGENEKWNQEVMCVMLFHLGAPNLASKGLSLLGSSSHQKLLKQSVRDWEINCYKVLRNFHLCPLQEQVQCQLSDAVKNV